MPSTFPFFLLATGTWMWWGISEPALRWTWRQYSRRTEQDRKRSWVLRWPHSSKLPTGLAHPPTYRHQGDKEFETEILSFWAIMFWNLFIPAVQTVPYLIKVQLYQQGPRFAYISALFTMESSWNSMWWPTQDILNFALKDVNDYTSYKSHHHTVVPKRNRVCIQIPRKSPSLVWLG